MRGGLTLNSDTLTTWLALYLIGCVLYGACRIVVRAIQVVRDFLIPPPRRRR